jgi:fluoride exporter
MHLLIIRCMNSLPFAVAAPVWTAPLAVSLGAALGALLRWQLAVWLNASFPALPPGTLLANVMGGYLVGLAVALFANQPDWSPAWRLFVITGFLGGLTTFSTFSAEVVQLLQAGRLVAAGSAITAHLAGSLVATLAGFWTYSVFKT